MRPQTWTFWASVVLTLSFARPAAAEDEKIVLWLRGGRGDERAMEWALRFELSARDMELLSAPSPDASGTACCTAAAVARSAARTAVDAVLWLEPDTQRRVLWLRVMRKGGDRIEQVPLPNTRGRIDPDLFAIAAASLLEQVLRSAPTADAAAAPGLEPPDVFGRGWRLPQLFWNIDGGGGHRSNGGTCSRHSHSAWSRGRWWRPTHGSRACVRGTPQRSKKRWSS
jgi:hypothetical protein